MGETVIPRESQIYEMHDPKFRNTKEKYIVICSFITDTPPTLGGLSKGKEYKTPLTAIRTPELRNAHDEVRGV